MFNIKKKIIFWILLILLLLTIKSAVSVDLLQAAVTKEDAIGDILVKTKIEQLGTKQSTTEYVYKIAWFRPAFVNVTSQVEVCTKGPEIFNGQINLTVVTCRIQNIIREVRNETAKSVPVYEQFNINSYKINGKTYTFDDKGCWVCGSYIACLKNDGGYAKNRAEKYKCDENNYPIIRSGESGFIENLNTMKVEENVNNKGVSK